MIRYRQVALVSVSVLMVGTYFWSRVPREGTDQFVDTFKASFQANDPRAISKLCSESELTDYGISREYLEKFIENEICPVLKNTLDANKFVVTKRTDRFELYLSPKEGSPLLFGPQFIVTTGQDGAIAIAFISSLFKLHATKYFEPKLDANKSMLKSIYLQAKHDGSRFESFGLKGVYLTATGHIETWSEREFTCRAKLNAMDLKSAR